MDIAVDRQAPGQRLRTYSGQRIKTTPTAVVADAETGKHVVLVEKREILYQSISKAIADRLMQEHAGENLVNANYRLSAGFNGVQRLGQS